MELIFTLPNCEKIQVKYILIEMNVPILFTLFDKFNNHYLGCCCDVSSQSLKFLVVKTEPAIISKLLINNITLYDAFHSSSKKFFGSYDFGQIQLEEKNDEIFLKNYYPMNELLEVDDDEFLEIKKYYSSFSEYIRISYKYKNIISVNNFCFNNIDNIVNKVEKNNFRYIKINERKDSNAKHKIIAY